MISHMQEILEALIESVLSKLGGMPFMLRYFFRVLFLEAYMKYGEEYGE
jgi:hypothetical protein